MHKINKMDIKNSVALQIKAEGRVQKVGYRNAIFNFAIENNIKGWVKNNPDGTVDIFAQGTQAQMDLFLEGCQKGSPLAMVKKININEVGFESSFTFFEVRK